jgi:iron complex outermembrane receptor protein
MKNKILTLISIGLFFGIDAQTGTITGIVSSTDGEPIELANVAIKSIGMMSVSTSQGEYALNNVVLGKYELEVSLNGQLLNSREIYLNANELIVNFIISIDMKHLQDVIIKGVKSANNETTEVGKSAIKPFDLPQSTAVIGRDLLEKQQTLHLSDALKNTNGVYVMGTSGGYQEEIAGRGFAFNSNNTFKNGVRFNNTIMPEMSSIERLEVMKGSTAILYGNVAAGGILNLVTKKPIFEKGGEISMRLGSYNCYKPMIDIYGSINKKKTIAFRLNSSYEEANSFRDIVRSERFYINPSFMYKLNKKTDILLEGDYLNDNRTADFGVPVINYTLTSVPRNTFIGTSWSYIKCEQKNGTATITHRLNENWQIKSVNSVQNFENELFSNVRPNSSSKFIKADGTWIRGLQKTKVIEKYYISQLDVTGKFSTGFLKHTLLFGVDVDKYITNTIAFNGITNYDTINVFDVNRETQRTDIPSLTEKNNTGNPRNRAGVYLQDLISVSEKIKVLAGVRFSYLESFSKIYTYSTGITANTSTYDHAISPRFGLVYQPIKTMAIFSSYSNSFTPNTGVDVSGKALVPSLIDQVEVGMKNDFYKGLLSVNVTAYQIVNSNLAQMSLDNGNTNTNVKELAGEVTSKGCELDITTKIWKGLAFIGGYSFNEARYTKSNIYNIGARLLYNPSNTANGSAYYSIENGKLKGVNVGVSALYFGKRLAGRQTRLTVINDTYKPIPLPEYTQLDLSFGYTKNNVSFRIKVSNLLNALSYNVHDDNSVNPIAPRMFAGTLTLKL